MDGKPIKVHSYELFEGEEGAAAYPFELNFSQLESSFSGYSNTLPKHTGLKPVAAKSAAEPNQSGRIQLSNYKIAEGMAAGTLVGKVLFDSMEEAPDVLFRLADAAPENDNHFFHLLGNKLRTRQLLLHDETAQLTVALYAITRDTVHKAVKQVRVLELPKFHLSGKIDRLPFYKRSKVLLVLYRKNERGRFEAIEEQVLLRESHFSFIALIQGDYTLSAKIQSNSKHYQTVYLGNVLQKRKAKTIHLYEDESDVVIHLSEALQKEDQPV